MKKPRTQFDVSPEQRERNIAVTMHVLSKFNREPFLNVLALVLECKPTPDQVVQFAGKHPDRWAQAIAILARLSGFHEKLEITGNFTVDIKQMGDAQLLQKLSELRGEVIPPEPAPKQDKATLLIEHKKRA